MEAEDLSDQLRDIKGRFNEHLGYCLDSVVSTRDRAVSDLRFFYEELDTIRRELYDISTARSSIDDTAADENEAKRARIDLDERERRMRARRDDLERERVRLERIVSGCNAMMNRLRLASEVANSHVDMTSAALMADSSASDAILGLQFAESENRRLAREIHDGPVQQFSAVMLMFDYLDKISLSADMDAIRSEISRIREELKNALADFRSFLQYLQPTGLDVGLGRAIARFADASSVRLGVRFDLEIMDEEDGFSMMLRTNLFRVVQEAVSNAVRHGSATEIYVAMWYDDCELHLTIRDDGTGFDLERGKMLAAARGSFGISNMSERVRFVNGSINVNSLPGQGTEITVIVPIDEEIYDVEGEY